MSDSEVTTAAQAAVRLPRVTIQFCTQCKWNLRAAYFAQELLQTFSTSLGEISLQPSTGGVFKIDITHLSPPPSATTAAATTKTVIHSTPIWDRKADGGFPETKDLKRRVRDIIEPGRNLGHVDRDYNSRPPPSAQEEDKAAAMSDNADDTRQQSTTTDDTPPAHHPLPRPRDIAAKASTLTHPPDAKQPKEHEWGTREGDRKVPSGVGGTKPVIRAPPPRAKDDGMEKEGAREEKCEDCE